MGVVILAICLYEAIALSARPGHMPGVAMVIVIAGLAWRMWRGASWPTITSIMHHHRDEGPWVALAIGAFSAWLYYHGLNEGRTL